MPTAATIYKNQFATQTNTPATNVRTPPNAVMLGWAAIVVKVDNAQQTHVAKEVGMSHLEALEMAPLAFDSIFP
jgi:hypothetical protein